MSDLKKITYYRPLEDKKGNLLRVQKVIKRVNGNNYFPFEVFGIKYTIFNKKTNNKFTGNNTCCIVAKYPNETSKNYLCKTIKWSELLYKIKDSAGGNVTKVTTIEMATFSSIIRCTMQEETTEEKTVEEFKKFVKSKYKEEIKC
jgi:hypothetical protein